MKFSIKSFFNKYDQIRSLLRIWSHLLKKSVMENFIFCAEDTLCFIFKFYFSALYNLWNIFTKKLIFVFDEKFDLQSIRSNFWSLPAVFNEFSVLKSIFYLFRYSDGFVHTSLWCLKRFYEGFKGLQKTFWGTTRKCKNMVLLSGLDKETNGEIEVFDTLFSARRNSIGMSLVF